MRKLFSLSVIVLLFPFIVFSQGYTLTLEEHATDIVPGLTTYRMYIDMVNTDDFLSSIYGGETAPLLISTSDNSFFNSGFGGATASSINPAFLAWFPELAADSWVTIGIDQQDEVAISTTEDPAQPFVECFVAGSTLDGQNVVIDSSVGGAWYVLNGTPNGLPDENMRVLFLQMTTAGEICGTINAQVFPHGNGGESQFFTFTFCGIGTYEPVVFGCTDLVACNYQPEAGQDDGSCDYLCPGCTDPFACNYNMQATGDDGSCDYLSCVGCTDDIACNFDPSAIYNDGSCLYNEGYYDCDGNCLNDFDGDGVCNELEVPGCTFAVACNFNPAATEDDGSCYFYCPGCTDEAACNYDAGAIQEDGSCEYPVDWYGVDYVDCDNVCLNDNDGDGVCDEDEIPGCTDPVACNFFAEATDQLIPCEYPDEGYDCEGSCLNDADGDGVCDPFDACPLDAENDADGDGVCGNDEVEGCTNEAACNFDPAATDDDGTCETIELLCGAVYFNCDCTCQSDADGDGICDEAEVPGCQEPSACNFNEEATDSDGSCEWSSCAGCIYAFACNYDPDAVYSDGSCEFGTCPGCTDPTACNFNPTVSEDDGSCTVNDECGECGGSGPELGYGCDGNCLDEDQDGVCDFDEAGCTDANACNFAPLAQEDDGSCTYPESCFDCTGACLDENTNGICDCEEVYGCTDSEACNFQPAANVDDGSCAPWVYVTGSCYSECPTCLGELLNDADADGVCDSAEIGACTDAEACNYDECATDDDGSCFYPEWGYDCEGNCTVDSDGDCVCDPEEIPGCTYSGACNFVPEATEEDGSCIIAQTGYDCDGQCVADDDGDGICNEFEVPGCTDSTACNFGPAATEDDGSCLYPPNANYNCNLECVSDTDGDGVCDGLEVPGCTDYTACNFNPSATDDNGSCTWPEQGLDCDGACLLDVDGNGVCDDDELALLLSFLNSGGLCGPGTFWDESSGQCVGADQCPMDFDGNEQIGSGDLLLFLAFYGTPCEEAGLGSCSPGVFDSNVDGTVFSVCPDVQSVTVVLTGATGGDGGSICGQTLGASTCNMCGANGGSGGAASTVEFVIANLSAGDELELVPGLQGENSEEEITCNPGVTGWTDWDCGPAAPGTNGGITQLLLNGEVIAEVAGGTGGTGACIGCQGDGCFDGADGVAGEVVLAPWINGAEASVLSVPQSGQLVLYY